MKFAKQVILFSSLLSSVDGTKRRLKGDKTFKAHKKTKSPKKPKGTPGADSAYCTREAFSVVTPNSDHTWTDHNLHNQVWYHTLNDIHGLWQEGYFDYVLDIRPLQDIITIDNNGSPLLLEGWETFHIPGSYPINVFPPDTPAGEVDMLVDFTSTNVCKDSRIFVHCWNGGTANMVAKTLIELGFTNVHAAGPEGSAGMWDWMNAGYEVVEDDTFEANSLVPDCMKACM